MSHNQNEFKLVFQSKLNQLLSSKMTVSKQESAAQAIAFTDRVLKEKDKFETIDNLSSLNKDIQLLAYVNLTDIRNINDLTIESPDLFIQFVDINALQLKLSQTVTTIEDVRIIEDMITALFSSTVNLSSNFNLQSDDHNKELFNNVSSETMNIAMTANSLFLADKNVNSHRVKLEIAYPTVSNGILSVDINEIKKLYDSLFSSTLPSVKKKLFAALNSLLSSMVNVHDFIKSDTPIDVLKAFLIIFELPNIDDPCHFNMLSKFFDSIDKLSVECKAQLMYWIATNCSTERYLRYTSIVRQFITVRVYESEQNATSAALAEAKTGVRVMSLFYFLLPLFPSVSYKEFYNDAINGYYLDSSNIDGRRYEFKLWVKDLKAAIKRSPLTTISFTESSVHSSQLISNYLVPEVSRIRVCSSSTTLNKWNDEHCISEMTEKINDNIPENMTGTMFCKFESINEKMNYKMSENFIEIKTIPLNFYSLIKKFLPHGKSFISFPFVLSPSIKASILEMHAVFMMQNEVQNSFNTALMTGQRTYMPYFILDVNRNSILNDTLLRISLYEDEGDSCKNCHVFLIL